MKKTFYLKTFILIGSFAFANNTMPSKSNDVKTLLKSIVTKDSNNYEEKDIALGRQCCTKTTFMADGSSVSITACAGWFLSDDSNAMTRACAKVDEAMGK